jgi:hypothetical protein
MASERTNQLFPMTVMGGAAQADDGGDEGCGGAAGWHDARAALRGIRGRDRGRRGPVGNGVSKGLN